MSRIPPRRPTRRPPKPSTISTSEAAIPDLDLAGARQHRAIAVEDGIYTVVIEAAEVSRTQNRNFVICLAGKDAKTGQHIRLRGLLIDSPAGMIDLVNDNRVLLADMLE